MNKLMRSRPARLVTAAVIGIALMLSTASACSGGSSNGNASEGAAQQAGTSLVEQNQPLPIFPTSAYRLELIVIEAIQALGTPTTAFFFPEGTTVVNVNGKQTFSAPPMKTCGAQGEPIPNTASLSNPQAPYQGSINTGPDDPVVGQMDPNGVYTPQSSSGTYVLCVSTTGGLKLTYWEGPVFDESGSAIWSDTTGITDVGPSALPACTVLTARAGDRTGLTAGARYYHCVDSAGKSVNSSAAP